MSINNSLLILNIKDSNLTFNENFFEEMNIVNGNIELDKKGNLGIGQFCPILFSLIDIILLSFLR